MKAAVRDRYGTVDVVRIDDIERPVPVADQVLVRVHAASVNRADLDGLGPRPGFARLFMGIRAPRIHRIGLDAAGVVDAVGPDATRFRSGDRVFGDLFNVGAGAFGEYVCAPEGALEVIPDGMRFEDAATLPHSATLAVQGLRLRNGRTIRRGDKVLVEGASGNVGPFAVQIAKATGAEVSGVCSTENVDFVRSLGADHVIDYRTTDFTKNGKRYDWILAAETRRSLFGYRRSLRPGGVFVTMGAPTTRTFIGLLFASLALKVTGRSMGLLLWWRPFHRPDVAAVTALISAGSVRPAIDRRFPLADVVEALRYVDTGHPHGKVIIDMGVVEPGA